MNKHLRIPLLASKLEQTPFRVCGTHLKTNLHGNISLVKVTIPPDYTLFSKKCKEKIVMYKK